MSESGSPAQPTTAPDPTSAAAPSDAELRQAQKRRSVVLALALAGFVALVFIITVVRLKEQVMARPL